MRRCKTYNIECPYKLSDNGFLPCCGSSAQCKEVRKSKIDYSNEPGFSVNEPKKFIETSFHRWDYSDENGFVRSEPKEKPNKLEISLCRWDFVMGHDDRLPPDHDPEQQTEEQKLLLFDLLTSPISVVFKRIKDKIKCTIKKWTTKSK